MKLDLVEVSTDILIIGGGAAGCFAALEAANSPEKPKILILEKANIKRSGCLAAGINALNAYINEDETPESFVDYVRDEFNGVVREDLVYTVAKKLNEVTSKMEKMGLTILKNSEGKYVTRGRRSIKINGENIKPVIASKVLDTKNIDVMNKTNVIDYITRGDKVIGAYAFSVDKNKFYAVYSKAVICAAGGASGIYKPNNPGFSRHKMWYSPFNTGSGYAMGIRAGAEMTTFEMRFIALRCKDTIAPTGTIAQGVKAVQINSDGEEYVLKYGKPTTINRLYSTVMENKIGRGPCFLRTKHISKMVETDLVKAYLNMAPSQALKWIDSGEMPSCSNVEIEGTEPYIVGGHAASGYWVDTKRESTLEGLFSAGDVSGGSPKKYATGCFAEGEIAADSAAEYIKGKELWKLSEAKVQEKLSEVNSFFQNSKNIYTVQQLEEAMQKTMDEYAGGISQSYSYNSQKLKIADKKIRELIKMSYKLNASDCHELMFICELIDRLYVCVILIAHLIARRETRWRCYEENADFPEINDNYWKKYVNSIYKDGKVNIIFRKIVGRNEVYEHKD